MSKSYLDGGLVSPGVLTLVCVDHLSRVCSNPSHIHIDECIVQNNPLRCVRRDEPHLRWHRENK